MNNNDPRSPRMLLAMERARQAVQLKIEGKTHEQIAQILGVKTRGAVSKMIKRGMKLAQRETVEGAENLRLVQSERLEKIAYALLDKCTDPNNVDYQAVDRMLRVIKQTVELHGLGQNNLNITGEIKTDAGEAKAKLLSKLEAMMQASKQAEVPAEGEADADADAE